jgi:dTDP-4-dehydrorhamnose reductase
LGRKPVYVIFGHGGIIGMALLRFISAKVEDYRIFAFDHARADITNADHVNHLLEYINPTIVFNCAGISDPEICEEAKAGAFRINGVGPGILAKACLRNGCRLVHFSSWGVLEGNNVLSCTEKATCKPESAYGQSKLHGEQSCLISCPNSIVIRTGWIFGEDQAGIISDWVSNAERRLNVRVQRDLVGSPTYVDDLVEAAYTLSNTDAKGIYNIANQGRVSWEQFAKRTLTLCKLPETLVTTSPKAFKATLPKNACLSCKKYNELSGKTLRQWDDALMECLFHMNKYIP